MSMSDGTIILILKLTRALGIQNLFKTNPIDVPK